MPTPAVTEETDRWRDQRMELTARLAAIAAAAPLAPEEHLDEPLGTLGETEHLAAYEQRHLDAALDALQRRELVEIERALERLAEGVYGTCVSCGADIAAERLDALPTAITCVGCPPPGP